MPRPPTKISLKPKRHHGYSVVLFILGTLFPPLAVAARFGVGSDFWLNLLLTICGYFPGHGHNFYIQNIRNNKNRARTPKWAARYGLVDTTGMDRRKKRSEWAKRYGERLPHSTLENQAYEEGQLPDSSDNRSTSPSTAPPGHSEYWREDEEHFYDESQSRNPHGESTQSLHSDASGGRWTYPANFNEAVIEGGSRRKSRSSKKDRWARTEEAYSNAGGEGNSVRRKKKKKRSSEDAENLPRLDPEMNGGTDPALDDRVGGPQHDPFEHQF